MNKGTSILSNPQPRPRRRFYTKFRSKTPISAPICPKRRVKANKGCVYDELSGKWGWNHPRDPLNPCQPMSGRIITRVVMGVGGNHPLGRGGGWAHLHPLSYQVARQTGLMIREGRGMSLLLMVWERGGGKWLFNYRPIVVIVVVWGNPSLGAAYHLCGP